MNHVNIMLLGFITGCIIAACTIRIEPLGYKPPRKTVVYHKRHHGAHQQAAAHGMAIVSSEWLNEYHSLQHEHGDYKIPDDARINVAKDGKVRVPATVIKHFHDLSKTPLEQDNNKP